MKCVCEVNTTTNEVCSVNITLENFEERSILTLALLNLKVNKENIISLLGDSSKSKQYEIDKLNKINEMIGKITRPEMKVVDNSDNKKHTL